MRLRCDGIFNSHFVYPITAESDGEKILEKGKHLPKLWAIKYGDVFL